jgi:hypothetical protein
VTWFRRLDDIEKISLALAFAGNIVAWFGHPFLGPFIVIFAIAYWNPSS